MANGEVGGRDFFSPDHLAVIPEVRTLLKRVLKLHAHTLEWTGEEFAGYITFQAPIGDTYSIEDVLTVCSELAQEDLGVTAEVSTWVVRRREGGLVSFQPYDFEVQDEDLDEVPPARGGRFWENRYAADVRPVNGWAS